VPYGERYRDEWARIHAQNPSQYIDFASDDPFALGPELMRKIQEVWVKEGPYTSKAYEMPATALSPQQQALLQNRIARWNEGQRDREEEKVAGDRVQLEVETRLSYILPGRGAVADRFVNPLGLRMMMATWPTAPSDSAPLPLIGPVTLPALATRALYVVAASAEEAAQAAQEARRRGFTQLWPDIPRT
jgi:hypothetical protein